MNTSAKISTVRELLLTATIKGRDTDWGVYILASMLRRSLSWDAWLKHPVRIPALSLMECVRADIVHALDYGHPAPSAVSLMREGIKDGLSAVTPGNGNRARRRIDALNMGARRKCRMPAAPVPVHHLTCA